MNANDPNFVERQAIAENLGRLVLVWTHVEMTSHVILWGVIDPLRASDECRPLTVGQSLDWVWATTQELLSHKPHSEAMVDWFSQWKVRASEGRRKRNEAVHGWWLPTGELVDPYKVLDFVGRKSRKGVRDDVIPGGSAKLLEWIEEISAISEDQLSWTKGRLMPFLRTTMPPPDA